MQEQIFNSTEGVKSENITTKQIIESQYTKNKDLHDYLRYKLSINQSIFLPGNTPSLKNSKEIQQMNTTKSVCHKAELIKNNDGVWYCTKCNQPAQRLTRPILNPSKTVLDYQKEIQYTFNLRKDIWKIMRENHSYPYYIGLYFIRKSNHEFDFINAAQIIMDIMANKINEWLPDDSMLYILPEFLGYHHNKDKPGCIITFMDEKLIEIKKQLYL